MSESCGTNSEKVGLFQIVVLILSIVVLGALGGRRATKKELADLRELIQEQEQGKAAK